MLETLGFKNNSKSECDSGCQKTHKQREREVRREKAAIKNVRFAKTTFTILFRIITITQK